jgi:hypothetical protein
LGVGRKGDDVSLQTKIYIVAKFKEAKTGCNLAESSKEGCGSKRDVIANDGNT